MQTTSVVIVVLWRIAMFWNAEANVMPNITMPEAEQLYTVNDGDNITCTATGYPVPDIVWLNNRGVVNASRLITDSVTTANIGNLSSVSVSMLVTRNDAGVYMCVANNSVGNDTHTITIAVQLAPVITSPDAKQAYNITDGNSITCTATGYPLPDIVWLNNDESVVEENSANVMTTDIGNIPSVSVSMIIKRSDGGFYTCLANNSVGNDTSTVHITVQYKDCCGEPDILLTADCTTNKFVQLKWISRLTSRFHFCVRYHCNADDSVDYCSATEYCYNESQHYIHDPTTHTYFGEVPVVVPDNASCCFWVENVEYRRDSSIGCSKLVCCKNESQLPNITMPGAEQEYIIEGDNITCTATGYPVPDIVWLNNGSVVNASRLITDSAVTIGNDYLSSVSVSMIVTRNDAGVYTCLASNFLGNDIYIINITVESFPIVVIIPENYTVVTEGSSITCAATGYPAPDIVWLNNDGSVVDENRIKTDSVMGTGVGNLYNVSVSMTVGRNDAGVYKCIANNSIGNDTRTINITVHSIPVINIKETEQVYNITEGDSITCTATGYPVPDIVWLNNDGSVVDKNRIKTDGAMVTGVGNLYSVSVSMTVGRSDGGIYTCRANNSVGSDTSTVHITVQYKDCCGEPDILLTADCTTNKFVQLKWISRLTSRFHFCVRYHCNADDSVDYCSTTQYCYDGFNRPYSHDRATHTYLGEVPVVVSDNATCCFWVENVQYRINPSTGCSKLVCCKNESQLPNIAMPEAEQEYKREGDNITCTATGYPVPDIVWLNNDGSVVNASRLITDSAVTTDNDNLSSVSVSMIVTRNDAGVYTCLASNSLGNDIHIINITVESFPIVVIIPENYTTVTEGSSITCAATGYPVPDIVWLNNDGSVVDENRIKTDSAMATGVGNLYNVSVSMTVGRYDARVYICIANNSIGDDAHTIDIDIVNSIPIITTPENEQSYTLTEGDNITCTATGYPVPDSVWLSNGSVVDENRIKTGSAMVTGVGNLYNVSASMTVGRNDAGIYKCIANNSIGNDTRTINITVHSFPIITTPETEQVYNVTEGDNITCTATGYPVPDIVWLNNDGSVVEENRLIPASVMTTDICNIPSVSVSMIIRRSDGGIYTCRANNSVGNDTSTVHITVQPLPTETMTSKAPSQSPKLTGLYIITCVIFILMVLLSTFLICSFSFWWKKSKRKNTELEITVKTQIEKYFNDTDDLPKDCISEVEVVIDNKDHGDGISITEDELDILAMISNKRPTSLSSSIISIINNEKHDGIADISESATTHYCNGGSAGSQSNTSSQRASCTSATPLSTDT